MREGWEEVTLGELLSLEYGKALPAKSRVPGDVTVYGSNGIVGRHNVRLVQGPGIVVGRKGTAGSVTWSDSDFFPIDTTYWAKVDRSKLSIEFAFHVLCNSDLPRLNTQTGVPGLNRENVYREPVALPPLHEQRRIVDLMDSVDAAISAAQAEVDAATEVLGALRDQLPAGRPGTVGDIVREIVNGVTTTARDQASGTGVQRFVKASAVQPGEFLPEETKQAPDVKFDEKYYVRQGDVLMTRINTPERVGNIARVSSEVEGLLRPDLVWRIEVGPNAVPDYLVNALSGKRGRARVSVAAAGTSRSMQQISKSRFLKVELPIPSTEAQHEYVSICRSAQLAVLAARESLDRLRDLRSSMLSVLLSGEHEIPGTYDQVLELSEGKQTE